MGPGEGAGVKKLPLYLHSLHSTSGHVKDELEIMAASAEALRTRGFTDIHCVLRASRAAALYRAYTFLKRSLQVKTVVVLAAGDGAYDAVVGGALRIGSLCYEGLADGVLIMTRDRAHVDRRSVQQLLDVAKGTLSSIGRFPVGFTIISCPMCGRCEIDIPGMTERVQRLMHSIDAEYCERGRPLAETGGLRVAVMGCNVNGPGEARGADIGIAGGKKGSGTIFMNGEVHATLPEEELFDQFTQLVRDLADERTASF
jgi:(E)-4-hydroxy-3-methylbut-2-enyl-diphosphate synthase